MQLALFAALVLLGGCVHTQPVSLASPEGRAEVDARAARRAASRCGPAVTSGRPYAGPMLLRLLHKVHRDTTTALRRTRARFAPDPLAASAHPAVRRIGVALAATLRDDFSQDERAVIAGIEKRRKVLSRSDRHIYVVDYGAGPGAERRSRDEMEHGVSSMATVAGVSRGSKPAFWAGVLFRLVRALGPASCVELGSCVGISAAYQAAALGFNGRGALVTLEGAPEVAAIARATLGGLGGDAAGRATVVVGPFHQTLAGVLAGAAPVDFFFNDGHHDGDAVLLYVETALPYLAPGAVVVIDDIDWSPGMRRAWTAIEADPRVAATVDLATVGIAVLGAGPRETFRLPL